MTRTSYPKAFISVLLTIAVATVFTIRSFASPDLGKVEEATSIAQDCTGTLTVIAGRVSINGNAAQTGATVLTGSAISTDSKGKAAIDLGAAGRVELGESTAVTLICVGTSIEIRSNCSKIEVEVRRGTLEVKTPKAETLVAGKNTPMTARFMRVQPVASMSKSSAKGARARAACMSVPACWDFWRSPDLEAQ